MREPIGELSTVSTDFRTHRAAHDVRVHHGGVKRFHHPDSGRRSSPTSRWTCPSASTRHTP
ncbi:hypothetical protein [Streptomyces sp. NPDC048521]|uniref:MmyB family transcriptional regulator n=1 Tax=Streptomyces sp. NPDC048521 TaxID=3365566 RepID=UPI00371C1846